MITPPNQKIKPKTESTSAYEDKRLKDELFRKNQQEALKHQLLEDENTSLSLNQNNVLNRREAAALAIKSNRMIQDAELAHNSAITTVTQYDNISHSNTAARIVQLERQFSNAVIQMGFRAGLSSNESARDVQTYVDVATEVAGFTADRIKTALWNAELYYINNNETFLNAANSIARANPNSTIGKILGEGHGIHYLSYDEMQKIINEAEQTLAKKGIMLHVSPTSDQINATVASLKGIGKNLDQETKDALAIVRIGGRTSYYKKTWRISNLTRMAWRMTKKELARTSEGGRGAMQAIDAGKYAVKGLKYSLRLGKEIQKATLRTAKMSAYALGAIAPDVGYQVGEVVRVISESKVGKAATEVKNLKRNIKNNTPPKVIKRNFSKLTRKITEKLVEKAEKNIVGKIVLKIFGKFADALAKIMSVLQTVGAVLLLILLVIVIVNFIVYAVFDKFNMSTAFGHDTMVTANAVEKLATALNEERSRELQRIASFDDDYETVWYSEDTNDNTTHKNVDLYENVQEIYEDCNYEELLAMTLVYFNFDIQNIFDVNKACNFIRRAYRASNRVYSQEVSPTTVKVWVERYYFDDIFDLNFNSALGSEIEDTAELEDYIYEYFTEYLSMTPEMACAIMGNIWAECSFSPSAVESNGEGVGLIQWSYDRKTAILNYAANEYGESFPSLDTQLNFLAAELGYITSANENAKSYASVRASGGSSYSKYKCDLTGREGYYAPMTKSDWDDACAEGDVEWMAFVFMVWFESPDATIQNGIEQNRLTRGGNYVSGLHSYCTRIVTASDYLATYE